MAKLSIHVLNVGGLLGEDENGVLQYTDGETKRFEALDINLLSIPELESMMKSLGYPNYSALYWLQPNAANLEFGLRVIKKESDVNELRKILLETGCEDFQIFVEHPISNPIIAEGVEAVNLDSDADSKSSSSHDSYESAEDEAYKPPPDGYESSSDSDGGKSKKVKKRGRTKKIMTPIKKASPKKNGKNTPTRKSSRRLGGDEFGVEDGFVDVAGGKGNDTKAAEGDECGKKVKKKGSRKYTEKRKEKSRLDFGPKFGSNGSGSQPTSDVGGL